MHSLKIFLLDIILKLFIVLLIQTVAAFSVLPMLSIPCAVAAIETKWGHLYGTKNANYPMETNTQPINILTVRDNFPQYRVYFSEKKIQKEVYEEFLKEKETKSIKK